MGGAGKLGHGRDGGTPVSRSFNHVVIDDFLPPDLHANLLQHTLANRDQFVPTRVYVDRQGVALDPSHRRSLYCSEGLGALKKPFSELIRSKFPELLQDLGIQPFELSGLEIELAAHGDGSHFSPHVDTVTRAGRDIQSSDRVITTVYYFHFQPQVFRGGQLTLFPLRKGQAFEIEPIDNRLVAFPAFTLHEVKPVVCRDDAFANWRFSVNCWFHRRHNEPAAPAGSPT
jgi:SM-20-related protein